MLLDEFYERIEGWIGPMELPDGKLKVMRMRDVPHEHTRPDGRIMKKYVDTKYYQWYNCCICGELAITSHMTKETKNKPRVCESPNTSGKGKTCHYIHNSRTIKTLKSNGQFSNKDNLTTKYGYPGWYQSTYDDEGMWVSTRFIFKHRDVMEAKLGRELEAWEKVHHIDMDKMNFDEDNLWVCNNSQHIKAHMSFNKHCREAMNNLVQFAFNKETGKYYLINKETVNESRGIQ